MDWIKKDNVGWIDVLRIVAIFAVVYSHTCDNFIARFAADRVSFHTGLFMECFARPCVVLMVMISGHLLLPLRGDLSLRGFYAKRIGRVAVPLVVWSLLLPVAFYLYFSGPGAATENPIIDASAYTSANLLNHLYTFVFNFNFEATPLWFLYMLIGLYLALPIVNAWLVQASRRDVQTVLLLWFVSLWLPYLRVLVPFWGGAGSAGFAPLWGECEWNSVGALYYVSGFMGYMILAYYLKTYPLCWSWAKTLAVAVPVYAAGYAVTSLGYIVADLNHPGSYTYLEIPWYMCGINVAMQAFGVYVVFMKLQVRSRAWLSQAASMMFGVYLCHFPIVQVVYDWFHVPSLPYGFQIVCISLTSFALSFLLTWLLYRLPLTRRIVK